MNKTLALLLLAIMGCAVDSVDDGDGPDDDFLGADDKADTGGISADEAAGVLRVANELSATKLHAAGVTTTAARNIVAYRTGDDGKKGTADDETFDTLRELDAVPYVGPVTFQKLLAYAKAHGYVVPFDHFTLPACAPMSDADLLARFPAGASTWHTGTSYALATRSRDCNVYTGCSAWRASSAQVMEIGNLTHALHALPASGSVDLNVQSGPAIHLLLAGTEPGNSPTQITWDCVFSGGQVADQFSCEPKIAVAPYDSVYGYFPQYYFGDPVGTEGNRIDMKGIICTDGRFGLVSKLAAEHPDVPSDSENNKNQIAIWGAL